MRRVLDSTRCLVLAAVVAATPVPVGAQGAVSGRVTLAEPAGSARQDVSSTVVFLEPVNRLARSERPNGELSAVSIVMRDREFVPHVQIVGAGGTVDFPNHDPFSHNVFSNTSLGAFDLGLYRRGATRSATFARVGVYAIYCNIHSSMVSFVVAVPPRGFARVDANGQFAIAGVAAGKYVMHVWHERAPEVVETLDVPAGGTSAISIALDTRGFESTVHFNKFGQTYPPARADRY